MGRFWWHKYAAYIPFIALLLLAAVGSACSDRDRPPPSRLDILAAFYTNCRDSAEDELQLCVRRQLLELLPDEEEVTDETVLLLTLCLREQSKEEFDECGRSVFADTATVGAGDLSGGGQAAGQPVANKLIVSKVTTEPLDCTRKFNGVLNSAGTFAVTADGQYIAGSFDVNCLLRLTITAAYETTYDPGYIRCEFANNAQDIATYPVAGSGVQDVNLYIDNHERFDDYNGDYEPDNLPGPDDGWYPPLSCVLTDDINGRVYGAAGTVDCYEPGSVDPMPPDACILGFASDAAMVAQPYAKVEDTALTP